MDFIRGTQYNERILQSERRRHNNIHIIQLNYFADLMNLQRDVMYEIISHFDCFK